MSFSFGEDIEPKHICSHQNSSFRWASETSTLTQNQDKIDISFYELDIDICLLYTSPSPRDKRQSRMPSSA